LSGSAIGSSRLARERSRTDPGHVSRIPSRSPRVPATPRVPPPVSTVSTPGRANHGTPLNRRYAAISDSSGSELNLQGERGRALFVTNAVIVPSSSSSSEDIEESQLVPNADLQARLSYIAQRDYPCDRKLTQSGVGLGLGPAARMSNTPSQSHSHAVPPPSSSGLEADIDNEHDFGLVDEDAATLAISSSSSSAYLRPLMSNPRTLPNLTRNISTSTGGTLPNPWGHDDVQPSESDQRRRELIELVNEMDHGSLGSTQPYEYDGHSDDEYAGEQGLAISPSDNFGPNADTPLVRGGGDDLRHRSPASGRSQATPRQPATRVALGCGNSECSSPGKLLGRVYMQSAEAHKKDQEAEFSPLSEYSDDEDAQYGTNNNNTAESPPFHRNHRGPLRQDLFRSDHEGDYPWSSLDSSNRTSTVSPAHPTSIHRRRYRSGTAGWSENARRTSRGSPVASPSTANVHGAYGPDRTRSVSRVRERNGTQQRSARTLNLAFPHVDSTSSTSTNTSSVRWRSEEQDINIHGEVNLEQLGPSRQSATINSQWQEGRKPSTIHPTKSPAPREAPESHSQPAADQPESHNTQRVYGGANAVPLPQHDRRDSQISAPEQRTWFSTISSSAYHSLLGRYGEVEMERQQVIWDLCETERAFVRRLRTFVQLFIRPLRMKDSVTWLAGVPPEVARLFDWLEDIINIHAQISSALRAIVAEQYPIVMQIAGKIRSFVSYLEVHQPYVVRLESVALLIKRLTEEPGSDFGEFIRIQQEQEECRGWSVESFLVEPVNRLVDYPIHFRVCTKASLRFVIDNLF
jgi:RhoGEF domain